MEPSILQKKAEILLERDVYPLLKNFPQAEKFSLSQEIKQSCFRLIRAAVMANNLTVVKKRLEWLDEADAEKTLLLVLLESPGRRSTSPRRKSTSCKRNSTSWGALLEACKSTSSTTDKKVNRTYLGLSLYGVEPREPWVQFGPQLELERLVQSEREPRFPPRLVGYYVIRGYGFECVSLLYFKGEVILRLVSDGVKTVTNLRPALSYWEAGASLQCGYKPAS